MGKKPGLPCSCYCIPHSICNGSECGSGQRLWFGCTHPSGVAWRGCIQLGKRLCVYKRNICVKGIVSHFRGNNTVKRWQLVVWVSDGQNLRRPSLSCKGGWDGLWLTRYVAFSVSRCWKRLESITDLTDLKASKSCLAGNCSQAILWSWCLVLLPLTSLHDTNGITAPTVEAWFASHLLQIHSLSPATNNISPNVESQTGKTGQTDPSKWISHKEECPVQTQGTSEF